MQDDREQRLRRLALASFAAVTGLTVLAAALSSGLDRYLLPDQRPPMDVGLALSGTTVAVVGLLLSWARPRHSLGWLLQLTAATGALCQAGQAYGSRALFRPEEGLPLGEVVLALSAPLWMLAVGLPATTVLLRYPSGVVQGRWGRRLDRTVTALLVLLWGAYASVPASVTDAVPAARHPLPQLEPAAGPVLGTSGLALLLCVVLVAAHTVARLLRAQRPERQQLAWLLTTALLAVAVILLVPEPWVGTAAYACIPASIAVGVLRYRLLDLDVVVRRALLYGPLTAGVALVFVAVTAAVATVLPRGPAPEVVAASVVAVGLLPLRERLQRAVDQLVHGDRDDPWTALTRLGTAAGGAGLEEVAQALQASLRVPGVAVERVDGSVLAGTACPDVVRLPLAVAGHQVGVLAVGLRRGERDLPHGDRRLLAAVAPLVAVVLHAVDLADQLGAERLRVVEAASAERARLRRDLHDGLGPSLTGVGLGLEALQRRGGSDELVDRLRAEVSRSVEEVRRILDDLRPAALDELGLVGALRRRAEQASVGGLHITVTGPAGALGVRPDVETAAYRIADEALSNVVRHAGASTCQVEVRVDDGLHLVVTDDGTGIPAQRRGGVGLPSMRARAEQLGGRFSAAQSGSGTTVTVELPAGVPA